MWVQVSKSDSDIKSLLLGVWDWLSQIDCLTPTVRHWLSDLDCLTFSLWHWVSDIESLPLSLWHWVSDIESLTLCLEHWVSDIEALPSSLWNGVSNIKFLTSSLEHPVPDIVSLTSSPCHRLTSTWQIAVYWLLHDASWKLSTFAERFTECKDEGWWCTYTAKTHLILTEKSHLKGHHYTQQCPSMLHWKVKDSNEPCHTAKNPIKPLAIDDDHISSFVTP